MGLLDFLTSAKQTLAGSSVSPNQSMEGETNPGLMSKMNYGGVPMSLRLGAAIEALQRINHPEMAQVRLGLMALAKEQSDLDKKAEKEKTELQEKANRLADKLETSNPELAAALRENPELISDYGKGTISSSFEAKQHARDRGEQLVDQAHDDGITREGWNHQDSLAAKGYAQEDKSREDTQANQFALQNNAADIEAKKTKAEWDRDDALRKGRADLAAKITSDFMQENPGVQLNPPAVPGVTSAAPPTGPSPIPAPMPGSVNPQPRVAPGLLKPPAPVMDAPTDAPGEEGDAGDAPPQQVKIWSQKFDDPDLTATEAAQLTATFKATLAESAASGKDPDVNLALGATAETYRAILKNRNETTTAKAAADTVDQKTSLAGIKTRIDQADAAAAAGKSANQKNASADSVLDALTDIEKAVDDKESILPATGAGSYLSSFLSDTNARAVYTALKTVNANMGFDRLQQMKEASPTGGALGQIAVQELEMLHATLAALDPTDVNFRSNIAQVKKSYLKVQEINQNMAQDIENLRKQPTEEHKKEFDDMYGVDSHLKFTGE